MSFLGFPWRCLAFLNLLIFLGSLAELSSVANVTSLPSGGPDAVQLGEKRGQGSVAREQGPWAGLRGMGRNQCWCAGTTLTMPLHPQLTLLLVLEDRLHRQLTYDLLPSRLTGPGGSLGLGRALAVATTHLSSFQPTVPRTSLLN